MDETYKTKKSRIVRSQIEIEVDNLAVQILKLLTVEELSLDLEGLSLDLEGRSLYFEG